MRLRIPEKDFGQVLVVRRCQNEQTVGEAMQMAKPTPGELLVIYRRTLAKYETEGDGKAVVQRRLIARLEADLRSGEAR